MNSDTIHRRRWWTLAVLSLSLFIIVVDHTILNVGLPTLVRELDASSSELQWIVDAYILVFAGLLLTAGALGDRFGRRLALVTGLVAFGLGSVVAAFSQTAEQLIAVRAFMGVGGALIMPATLSILTNVFDEDERQKAIGAWAAVAGIAIVAGPTIGGWLLEHASWQWLFLVNLPILAIAVIVNPFLVPESRDEKKPRLDLVGSGLSILGLAALLYAIIEAPEAGWTADQTLAVFASAALILAAFVFWELRTPEPMLNVHFFENPRFSAASISITLVYFALVGTMFYLTQHLQLVQGNSTFDAGLKLAPVALAVGMAGPLAAAVSRKVGTKATVAFGLTVVAIGLGLFAAIIEADSGYLPLALTMVLSGLGMGLAMTPATDSIMGSLPRDKAGVGSAVNDTTREIGGALGVAILGSLLSSVYSSRMADDVAALPDGARERASDSIGGAFQVAASLDPQLAANLMDAARHAYIQGENLGILVGAIAALAGAIVALVFLPARAREQERAPASPPFEADAVAVPVRIDE